MTTGVGSSTLLGAWAPPGMAVTKLLLRSQREAMRRQLSGAVQREVVNGRLWLVASSGQLLEEGERVTAWEGFVCGDPSPAVGPVIGKHDGHYVMVHSDGRQLSLVRALSGGERLYVARVGGVVLFSASIRPLLAHPSIGRELDAVVTDEVLLTGHPLFGAQTPVRGIEEVLAGHLATVDDGGALRQQWHWPEALVSPTGGAAAAAKGFRQALCGAVEQAVGKKRPVAVALSGGIDSSAIAAAAVEVVGADSVHAFTYEFADTAHAPPETHYAKKVARALGIKRHTVFSVTGEQFLDAIPEHVWRSESAVHWPKAFLLPVARTIAAHGYDRYLTGFGIGSHMAYLRDLATVLPWVPLAGRTLRYWRQVRFGGWDWLAHLAKLHPGLEPPHPRLYDLLLQVLEQRGVVADRRSFYPEGMHALLQRRRSVQPIDTDGLPLSAVLQRHAFAHLVSCIDVTRSEKASREVGVARVAPAHFSSCIPYAYFPVEPAPFVWSRARHLRPGKLLLQLAYRGLLPDEVLSRKKNWDDAVTSRAWRRQGRVAMLRALPGFPNDIKLLGDHHPDAVMTWEPSSIQANCLSFWFWRELLLQRPLSTAPPAWTELWP